MGTVKVSETLTSFSHVVLLAGIGSEIFFSSFVFPRFFLYIQVLYSIPSMLVCSFFVSQYCVGILSYKSYVF